MVIGYEVTAEEVLRLFASGWWTSTRQTADVERMLAGSTVVFAARDNQELVGFARVLSDGVYLALILDVIVSPHQRGRGHGAALMEAIVAHPAVARVRSVELVCQPDLMPFYRRWGFTDTVGASRLMRRTADLALLGAGQG
jgi:predicted GNAT family N-acyltransferase